MIEAAADLFWILLYAMGALLVLGIGVLFTVETLKQIAKTIGEAQAEREYRQHDRKKRLEMIENELKKKES